MKSAITSCAILTLALFFGAWQAQAATITAGPTGQYASPCAAFPHMQDGDTLLVDANNGTPYYTGGCNETANYATITGVNGRPVIDPGGNTVYNALWEVYGHDVVIDNFEFRNTGPASSGSNSPGIWIKSGKTATPGGANVTIEQSYFYNNKMGLLSDNVGFGGYSVYAWYSPNPYITLQYDEFAASAQEANDLSHNIYISAGGNMTLNLQYSFSHDNHGGHELKSRAQHSNVYYNFIADLQGNSDFVMDFPLGGDTYVVGNVIYKADTTCCNAAFIVYRQYTDDQISGAYPAPYDDLHFVNNTAIDGANNQDPGNLVAFVNMGCYDHGLTTDQCPPPTVSGGPLTTPGVFENNIFVGPSSLSITNQTEAVLRGNILLPNNSTNLADLFVDPADLDFHLASGSPAIQAGVYPPTDNQDKADPLVLATDEYVHPLSGVARPKPSGSTMDAGAYSYPRAGNPPTLQLSYSNTVAAPNSGTITVSGMPTPPTGQSNYVVLVSQNEPVIPYIETAETPTGSVTVTYQTNPVSATVTVPIDIYANGAHATATVTVNPGPPTLYSLVVASSKYVATDQVNLEGPAPAGGVTVNLSSSDPSFLYTPATVTVPAGQISATVGTLATNFFTPSPQTETLTATAGGVTKTLTRGVYSPRFTGANCGNCTVVGGQPGEIYSDISYGPAPENGAGVTITSNNTAVIPNQTIPVTPGETDFPHSSFNVSTNAVSTTTTVTITAQFGPYSSSSATFTVTPGGQSSPASIAVVSGSGQTAGVGTNFTSPLVVVVKDSSNNPVSGATVTFAGTGVSFPSGATATSNSSGNAQVTAQPTASGSLTITASVSGVGTPASFSETGTTGPPSSVATVSGSGQTATVGTNFTSPLVAVVKDSGGNPVSGVTVTFAGSNVSFPSGATATSNTSGDAQVTAQPTATGALTVTATVAGVGTPATFSETGTSTGGGTLSSITNLIPQNYDPVTLLNLTGNATAPVTAQLSSSDPSIVYVPATVTIATGQSSARTGSLLGSLWGQSPLTKTATLSATYNGVTVYLTRTFRTVGFNSFGCGGCAVTGGQPITLFGGLIGLVPYGGAPLQITSNNTAVIPNQSFPLLQGANTANVQAVTHAVSTATTVQVTANYNGSTQLLTITVNP